MIDLDFILMLSKIAEDQEKGKNPINRLLKFLFSRLIKSLEKEYQEKVYLILKNIYTNENGKLHCHTGIDIYAYNSKKLELKPIKTLQLDAVLGTLNLDAMFENDMVQTMVLPMAKDMIDKQMDANASEEEKTFINEKINDFLSNPKEELLKWMQEITKILYEIDLSVKNPIQLQLFFQEYTTTQKVVNAMLLKKKRLLCRIWVGTQEIVEMRFDNFIEDIKKLSQHPAFNQPKAIEASQTEDESKAKISQTEDESKAKASQTEDEKKNIMP
jgi:hypothetical protein